jgi:hypothetical protein
MIREELDESLTDSSGRAENAYISPFHNLLRIQGVGSREQGVVKAREHSLDKFLRAVRRRGTPLPPFSKISAISGLAGDPGVKIFILKILEAKY